MEPKARQVPHRQFLESDQARLPAQHARYARPPIGAAAAYASRLRVARARRTMLDFFSLARSNAAAPWQPFL
jgi:argininosuccinate lyase